ncbi:MAG: FAD-binding oxidoreductase [Nanoarchaeota archaeon]|nr:FAD-binding oxidoreductase [Nanoarchaeota archaeon]
MTLSASLEKIFGPINFSDKDRDRLVYSHDASDHSGYPSFIVWPTSVEEIHKLILLCKRSNATLVPRGAGTSLTGASVPNESIVVDMSKMRKVLEIKDDYIVVEAGVPLADLNRELKYKYFPIQPESKASCTVGGMIATNAVGLKPMEYGRMEDWVESLTVIDGNGMPLEIKGDAVKHFCGAEGNTGIVLKAKLKLLKKEENRSSKLLQFNTITAMYDQIKKLRYDPDILNIEFMDEFCSSLLGFEDKLYVIAEFRGDKGEYKGKDSEDLWLKRETLLKLVRGEKYFQMEDVQVEEGDKFLHWLRKNRIPSYGAIGLNMFNVLFKEDRLVSEMKNVLQHHL